MYKQAVHEVGHALVAYSFGWTVRYLVMESEDTGLPQMNADVPDFWRAVKPNPNPREGWALYMYLAYCAAGEAGEVTLFNSHTNGSGDDKKDFTLAIQKYSEISGNSVQLDWNGAVAFASAILTGYQVFSNSIEEITDLLFENKTITGKDFIDLLAKIHIKQIERFAQ